MAVNQADAGRDRAISPQPDRSTLHRLVRAGEVVASTVLTLLGAFAGVAGVGYGVFVDGGRVGPGFVPLLAGFLLAGLGTAMLVLAVRRVVADRGRVDDGSARDEAEADMDVLGRTPVQRVRMLWSVLGLTLLAVVAVSYVGFLTAFGLLVLAVSVLVERRRVFPSVAVAAATVAVTYAVFGVFLDIPLPVGLLGQALGVE